MAINNNIRVRIAPSPTGNLHVGTARTALFNELFARHNNGTFIIRIEDTDKDRSKPEYEADILEGLRWLGITWDEGPDKGGPYGPYRQSERIATYTQALQQLLSQRLAYYCFCDPVPAGSKRPARCACADLAWEESSSRSSKEKAVIRLRVEPQVIAFTDHIRGEVATHTDTFGGDFVIAKSLAEPLFHLAVVVDDAFMRITHVIRGDDHISNTARHILIQQALGYTQPGYAHVPLLLDEARRKLSKRSGETSLLAYRDQGFLPEAMLNFLALLGWHGPDDRELYSHTELVEAFTLEQIQKSGAIFSLEKLRAVNKEYVRKLTPAKLFEQTRPFLAQAGIDVGNQDYVTRALMLEQKRIATLRELPAALGFAWPGWQPIYKVQTLMWRQNDQATTIKLLTMLIAHLQQVPDDQFSENALSNDILHWIDTHTVGRGDVLWPMRVALTGQEHSPGPFPVAALLGKAITLTRLTQALEKLTL